MAAILCMCSFQSKAQFVVTDPIQIAANLINAGKELYESAMTATNMVNNFKEVKKVYDQGKEYYDALKSVNNLVQDARKVRNTILMIGEISDIYIENFQKMMSDPHFRVEELAAISNGYAMLLQDGSDMLLELKDVVNVNGLSMSDSERITIINNVHDRVKRHRDLVNYYTRKNVAVSYLRAKKAGDTDRVIALYGNADERYW